MTGKNQNEADTILATLHALVEPLSEILPGRCEVVLHDLRKLPNSIVAIAGEVSGRKVGGPATDMLLRETAQGTLTTMIGYATGSPGMEYHSSTIAFRDSSGDPVATLCINLETGVWRLIADLANAMIPQTLDPQTTESEHLPGDVEELASHVLTSAITAMGVPVPLMQKQHKVAVIQALKKRGLFQLKDGIEMAATALGVTRFSVYNYLHEVEETEDSS